MSISPPTDIVLDVARAAEPERYRQAVERLARIAASADPQAFADVLDTLPTKPAASAAAAAASQPSASASPPPAAPSASPPSGAAGTYRSFEAMTLATFIEAALPKDAPAVFGSGVAGDVWKSMLAEQIAGEMARHGGIGIADKLASSTKTPGAGESAASGALGDTVSALGASFMNTVKAHAPLTVSTGLLRPDPPQSSDDPNA